MSSATELVDAGLATTKLVETSVAYSALIVLIAVLIWLLKSERERGNEAVKAERDRANAAQTMLVTGYAEDSKASTLAINRATDVIADQGRGFEKLVDEVRRKP